LVKDPLGNVVSSHFQSDGDSDGYRRVNIHWNFSNFHSNAPVSYPVPLASIPFSGNLQSEIGSTDPAGKEIPSIITVDPTDATTICTQGWA